MQGNSNKFGHWLGAFCMGLALTLGGISSYSWADANTSAQQATVQAMAQRLDINQASKEQLSGLPGIGPVKAEAIVAWREQQGRFTSLQDLENIKGIGARTAARLEPLISF